MEAHPRIAVHLGTEVEDTGRGMEPHLLTQVLEGDQLASRPGTAQESGAGLGLFLVREFCEAQGGRLWAESRPGEGTTFGVALPQSD